MKGMMGGDLVLGLLGIYDLVSDFYGNGSAAAGRRQAWSSG